MSPLLGRAGWIVAGVLGLFVVVAMSGIVSGGPLDPAGPPAPTLKTLNQVEPRTPLSQPGVFPITISQPGSYYLTGNITGVAGQQGIIISADNVTIDLMGFTLAGVPGSVNGIVESASRHGTTLRNGTISGWGSKGIDLTTSSDIVVDAINARENVVAGIDLGSNARVSNCVVTSTASYDGGVHVVAIRAGSAVSVTACSTRGYTTGIAVVSDSQVLDSTVVGAYATGIYGGGATIERCTVTQIGGATGLPQFGILTQPESVSGRLSSRVSHNLVDGVTASGDYAAGIRMDGTGSVIDNTVAHVDTVDAAQAVGIDLQHNFSAVHDNDIFAVGTGIRVPFGLNTVYGNHIRFVLTPISAVAGNDVAPSSTAALATSPVANIVD